MHQIAEGDVVESACDFADQIRGNTPFGTWMTKEILWSSLDGGTLDSVIALEARSQILALLTADSREQRSAARDRRPPHYHDE